MLARSSCIVCSSRMTTTLQQYLRFPFVCPCFVVCRARWSITGSIFEFVYLRLNHFTYWCNYYSALVSAICFFGPELFPRKKQYGLIICLQNVASLSSVAPKMSIVGRFFKVGVGQRGSKKYRSDEVLLQKLARFWSDFSPFSVRP